jgi:hypothetical protein
MNWHNSPVEVFKLSNAGAMLEVNPFVPNAYYKAR